MNDKQKKYIIKVINRLVKENNLNSYYCNKINELFSFINNIYINNNNSVDFITNITVELSKLLVNDYSIINHFVNLLFKRFNIATPFTITCSLNNIKNDLYSSMATLRNCAIIFDGNDYFFIRLNEYESYKYLLDKKNIKIILSKIESNFLLILNSESLDKISISNKLNLKLRRHFIEGCNNLKELSIPSTYKQINILMEDNFLEDCKIILT